MKITVIQKTTGKVRIGGCPWVIDEPPVAKS